MNKIYYYSFECEHDGDIAHERMDLDEAGCEIVDVETTGAGLDRDYKATVYFRVPDPEKFKQVLGYDCTELSVCTWKK